MATIRKIELVLVGFIALLILTIYLGDKPKEAPPELVGDYHLTESVPIGTRISQISFSEAGEFRWESSYHVQYSPNGFTDSDMTGPPTIGYITDVRTVDSIVKIGVKVESSEVKQWVGKRALELQYEQPHSGDKVSRLSFVNENGEGQATARTWFQRVAESTSAGVYPQADSDRNASQTRQDILVSGSEPDASHGKSKILVIEATQGREDVADVIRREAVAMSGVIEFGHDAAGGRMDLATDTDHLTMRYVWDISDAEHDVLSNLENNKTPVKVEGVIRTWNDGSRAFDATSKLTVKW